MTTNVPDLVRINSEKIILHLNYQSISLLFPSQLQFDFNLKFCIFSFKFYAITLKNSKKHGFKENKKQKKNGKF